MKKIGIFIFRRDLRLDDNTGLLKACSENDFVIPLFCVVPRQVSDSNKYKSSNCIQFMIESLYDLQKQIKKKNKESDLWINYGDEIEILEKIYEKIKINGLYINEDYTPYAIERDNRIKNFCETNSVEYNSFTDLLLLGTNDITTGSGTRYKVFTQFKNKTINAKINDPVPFKKSNFLKKTKYFDKWNINDIDCFLLKEKFYEVNDNIAIRGGRTEAIKKLQNLAEFRHYKESRDKPSLQTTKLSAHNKFGTVSIREVYWAFKKIAKSDALCEQLYWRDFYYYVGYHFPQFYKREHISKKINKKSKLKWENKKRMFDKWKNGETGFPIVDAGMRELNKTGFMHNRVRMIVSSFLVKDLLINWKYGELYFSEKLVDIDRAQNTGNWNWSSSFGMDNASFLRIFNPWSQSSTYDPDCEYIKYWIPELKNLPSKEIHNWNKYYDRYENINYPKPIVDHDIQRKKFISFYNNFFVV